MRKLQKLKLNKFENQENFTINDLNKIRGGGYLINGGTLDTVTVTPNGNKDDGYDDWVAD